jgi:hypothetical protein
MEIQTSYHMQQNNLVIFRDIQCLLTRPNKLIFELVNQQDTETATVPTRSDKKNLSKYPCNMILIQ